VFNGSLSSSRFRKFKCRLASVLPRISVEWEVNLDDFAVKAKNYFEMRLDNIARQVVDDYDFRV